MVARESKFQRDLIDELKFMFPGSIILKNDAGYRQGIPDLIILWEDRWATLEVKKSYKDFRDNTQPNQPYYVDLMNQMSFSAFIYPENKEDVLYDLQQTFRA